jgi:hypothetical protein
MRRSSRRRRSVPATARAGETDALIVASSATDAVIVISSAGSAAVAAAIEQSASITLLQLQLHCVQVLLA